MDEVVVSLQDIINQLQFIENEEVQTIIWNSCVVINEKLNLECM